MRVADESNEIDRLFDAPLADFTAARDEVARELKAAGKAERAAEVAALRKPTVPVWVVNQLARRQRRDVDLLLDAGHRLRAAQGESDPEQAREAFQRGRDAERDALKRLRAAAEELLLSEQGKATGAMVERALATLRAASVTEEGRELLARGRLTEELTTTGFDLAATLVPPRAAPRRARKTDAVASARAEVDRAKAESREAAGRLRDAERRAASLRKELDAAEAEVEAARAEAEKVAEQLSSAEAALKEARGKG